MSEDIAFRIVGGILSASLRLIRLCAHWRAGSWREQLRASREGSGFYLIAAVVVSHVAAVDAFIIWPRLVTWGALPVPTAVRWIGAALWGLAVVLLWWIHRVLGANFSPNLRISQHQTLTIAGPYRWVRHPMYTAATVYGLGASLLCANWFVALTAILFCSLMLYVRTPKEEAMMLDRFGDAYRQYSEHTGRFVPRSRL